MRTNSMGNLAGLLRFFILFSILRTSTATDAIQSGQSIIDGETLVSASGSFVLGFFSPPNSRNRYVGLWYMKSPKTVVWVANREVPLSNKLGALNITNQGILVLLDSKSNVVWSSNTSRSAQRPVAQLLDSGNLVVREGNDNNRENFLWQSFDYPCDTQLPGMKVGFNFLTRFDRFLSSWKSAEDPARGEFSLHIDPHGYPQILLKKGNMTQFRGGSWNGLYFTGVPALRSDSLFTFEFVFQNNEAYFIWEPKISIPSNHSNESSVLSRHTLNPLGVPQRFEWSDQKHDWVSFSGGRFDKCENYAFCGPNARCEAYSSPACACLDGFMPKSPRDWDSSVWSQGCIRRTQLDCNEKVGFLRYAGFKLPDTSSSWFNKSIGPKECERLCLQNCSCTAYANLDIREGGSGCLIWFGDLIDVRSLTESGQDLHVRVVASELAEIKKRRSMDKKKEQGIIASSIILALGLLILGIVFYTRKTNLIKNDNSEDGKEDMDLPIYDLITIAHATNNFSSSNKLGEGGFGPVYKGTLIDGQEIAVKRLSKSSRQGTNEFKNEVMLIAKLQHRNLVKLVGCCIHKDEQMLIYEFMPNKSLDSIIFDSTRSKLLDWGKRIHIIDGIARGLLYLHQDSRLRIIHRDIKAGNILLDNELNPKISDFGLARMFGADQAEANTNRVVGTYGYMSPEYALHGHFSVKSDVFSFGVLVLEIVSGKKNRGFCHQDQTLNLLGHAWMLWTKGTPLDLIDECLTDSRNPVELLRCIHVALLCGQQRPEDRPNMSAVVVMLDSENPLPQPKQPGFFRVKNPCEPDTSSNKREAYSANEVSLTSLEAR